MMVKGIVLWQPYAWAMFHGKDVENRSKPFRYRGPLVILAGKHKSPKFWDAAGVMMRERGMTPPGINEVPYGGILGAVDLWDVTPPSINAPPTLFPAEPMKWHFREQWGWRCRRPVEFPFRPYVGERGIMNIKLTEEEESLLRTRGA